MAVFSMQPHGYLMVQLLQHFQSMVTKTVIPFCLVLWALDLSFLGASNLAILTALKFLSSIKSKNDNNYDNSASPFSALQKSAECLCLLIGNSKSTISFLLFSYGQEKKQCTAAVLCATVFSMKYSYCVPVTSASSASYPAAFTCPPLA